MPTTEERELCIDEEKWTDMEAYYKIVEAICDFCESVECSKTRYATEETSGTVILHTIQ